MLLDVETVHVMLLWRAHDVAAAAAAAAAASKRAWRKWPINIVYYKHGIWLIGGEAVAFIICSDVFSLALLRYRHCCCHT
jgi:hypothetical protein